MKTPKMTRAHFQMIADCLRVAYINANNPRDQRSGKAVVNDLISDFSIELQRTNGSFNKDKFIKACKGE